MIASWPSELPRPDRQGWQVQPQDARRKRQSEAGPPSYRRRFSAIARMVSMQLLLTRQQRAVFDRFFHETCEEGSLHFHMADPTTDGWPILTASGAPLLDGAGRPILMARRWLCAWGDQVPSEGIEGVMFRKTCSIVVLP